MLNLGWALRHQEKNFANQSSSKKKRNQMRNRDFEVDVDLCFNKLELMRSLEIAPVDNNQSCSRKA